MPQQFDFSIEWVEAAPQGDSDRATQGHATLKINERPVWRRIEWSWSDLIEWLAGNWKHLLFETGNPLGLELPNPFLLRGAAEQEWKLGQKMNSLSEEAFLEQEESVFEYEYRHNLAHALKGADVPSVVIAREDAGFSVGAEAELARIEYRTMVDCLQRMGETIAARLQQATGETAQKLLADWRQRWPKPSTHIVSLNTTLSLAALREIAGDRTIEETWELAPGSFQENELLAAARMAAGRLSPGSIKQVLDVVRHQPRRSTAKVDALSITANGILVRLLEAFEDPHRQGRRLAQWLREQPGIATWESNHAIVHPNKILEAWDVKVIDISLAEPALEGLGVWGDRHGPVVIVNATSPRANRPTARRSILAHEICHLLVDRKGSLPLAEVMEGRIRPVVEQRARAFGAELLLPTDVISRTYVSGTPVGDWVDQLSQTYGASFETCAWQIKNTPSVFGELQVEDVAYLALWCTNQTASRQWSREIAANRASRFGKSALRR